MIALATRYFVEEDGQASREDGDTQASSQDRDGQTIIVPLGTRVYKEREYIINEGRRECAFVLVAPCYFSPLINITPPFVVRCTPHKLNSLRQ